MTFFLDGPCDRRDNNVTLRCGDVPMQTRLASELDSHTQQLIRQAHCSHYIITSTNDQDPQTSRRP